MRAPAPAPASGSRPRQGGASTTRPGRHRVGDPLSGRRPPRGAGLTALALALLVVLGTACGGVINPPGPRPTPPPPPTRPTSTPPPTPEPEQVAWIKNHRVTEMWSGPEGAPGVISFGKTSSTFCLFRVDREQDDVRLYVYNPYDGGHFWIDSRDTGPVEAPDVRAGPRPPGQNCAGAIYDPTRPSATSPADRATTTATATPLPAPEARLGQPLVLGLYYPWYDLDTWASGETADQPVEPYLSSDPAAIRRHVGWARDAGLDVLVSAWFGPQDDNPTESNFRQLLAEAQRGGIRAALLLETDSDAFFPDRAALTRALRHALDTHAAHPAYLRVDGRPVVLVWNPRSVYGADGRRVNARSAAAVRAWSDLLDEVDPRRRALWIAEGDFFDLLTVFDGIFPYSVAWAADPATQLASYGRTVRDRAAAIGARKVWAATAMPGYDDTRIEGRAGTFAVPRQDGAYYERTFAGAIASHPDWIVVTSFNEWLEGSQIEPSASYGRQYIDQTRTLVDRFRRAVAGASNVGTTPTPGAGR